jgi:hypothetical protein
MFIIKLLSNLLLFRINIRFLLCGHVLVGEVDVYMLRAHCRSSHFRLVTQSVHQAQPGARQCNELCLPLVGGVFCAQHECKNYCILCVCGL